MKRFFVTAIFVFVSPLFLFAQGDSASLIADIQAQIAALQARIKELQLSETTLLSPAGGFNRDLFLGAEGDDVRNLQQFLAQDKEIYPTGLVTGYYGPLTEKAVQRFQEKHGIIASGTVQTTGYGRVGPKTRAKLSALLAEKIVVPKSQTELPQQESQEKPPSIEDRAATISPEPEAATSTQAVSSPKPTPNIKSGAGSAITNSVFDFGTGAIHYKELGRLGESGAFYLGITGGGKTSPPLFAANVTSSKENACDSHDGSGFADVNGPKSICKFIDAANYTFSNTEEAVRFHEKASSCYDGLVLFRQNNFYGGIEPEDITKNGDLTYHYWYDASGGSDFSSWCLTRRDNMLSPALASVLGSLGDVLDKIQSEIKKLSR